MVENAKSDLEQRVSRRQFLACAGATGATISTATAAQSSEIEQWDHETDVVVCGSGAAGLTAAVVAAAQGQRVLVLEKAKVLGGTTAKSGGVWWAPDNFLMRRDGRPDPRRDALAYMARLSSPQFYDPALPKFGLLPADYTLLEAYVDNTNKATDELVRLGALTPGYYTSDGKPVTDFYSRLPENKTPMGRGLVPVDAKGEELSGVEFIRQLSEAAKKHNVGFRTEHRVERLVVEATGRVVGVQAQAPTGRITCRAKRGVIFGTGGFTHNVEMAANYLRGPIFGGCAVPTNTGDFVAIASQVRAGLGNMSHAWWCEVVLEEALQYASVPSTVFLLQGDSMLAVNRLGKRMVNEKMAPNERMQALLEYNASRAEYTNLLSFMIYDERVAQRPGYAYPYPIPVPGFDAPHVIKGKDLPDLTAQICARLRAISPKSQISARISSSFELAPDFTTTLAQSIHRFNEFAKTGNDLDFQRGAEPSDHMYMSDLPPSDKPNKAMYPLSDKGPYYCIILAPGTLDTKGGPVVNEKAQVLDVNGHVIPGLFAAGNCIASPAKQAYWASGATIGAAMAFGYLAGITVANS